MANQFLHPHPGRTESYVADLYFEAPVGAAGAPGTAVLARGFAATPIVRNSAGNYTLSLLEPWNKCLEVVAEIISNAAQGAGVGGFSYQIQSRTVTGSTPSVVIVFLDTAGAAADPPNGSTMCIRLSLQNGSRV